MTESLGFKVFIKHKHTHIVYGFRSEPGFPHAVKYVVVQYVGRADVYSMLDEEAM
jgi:hypothetical protein